MRYVIGLLLGAKDHSTLSVDPIEIAHRGYQGSAGIADIRYDNDFADLVGTYAGEEWDRITRFRETLSPEAQDKTYGRDRTAARRLVRKLAKAECPELEEGESGWQECVASIESRGRQQANDMLQDEMIHTAVEKIAELLQSQGSLDGFMIRYVLLSDWGKLKEWQTRA